MSGHYLDGDDVGRIVDNTHGDIMGVSSGLPASDMDGDGVGSAMDDTVGDTVGLSKGLVLDDTSGDDI